MSDSPDATKSTAPHDDADSPMSNNQYAGSAAGVKRKRGGGSTSSRTVANLTPEQLDKKRKNDREAQRAIRERTRAQIDRLNQRIADLEGSDHFQERMNAMRHRDMIQSENDELKRKMAQVVAMLSPVAGNNSQRLDDLASAALERNAIPIPQSQPIPHPSYLPAPRAMTSPAVSVMSPVSHSSLPHNFGSNNTVQVSPQRTWDSPAPGYSGYDGASPRPHSSSHDYRRDDNNGLGYVFDNHNNFAPAPIPIQLSSAPESGEKFVPLPHNVPRLHKLLTRSYASCALDNLLLDYLRDSQRRIIRGESSFADETGPEDPDFNTLVKPMTRHKGHQLSKLFIEILGTFPDLRTLPEQIAVVYMMFSVFRWQIHPSKENYERIPEWMRPVHVQILTPHPHWVDYIPWPNMRLVATQDPVDINVFFIPFTTTLSLNWPYDPSSCLIPQSSSQGASPVANMLSPTNQILSPASLVTSSTVSNSNTPTHLDSDRLHRKPPAPSQSQKPSNTRPDVGRRPEDVDDLLIINPLFREHMCNLDNWSLGEAFAREFPRWRGTCKIKT